MSDEQQQAQPVETAQEQRPPEAPKPSEHDLLHGILGGLIAAVRHLVMVTPAAHNLSAAVDQLAATHNELRILTSPPPETPPPATDPTDQPPPAPEPDPAPTPTVSAGDPDQPQF